MLHYSSYFNIILYNIQDLIGQVAELVDIIWV